MSFVTVLALLVGALVAAPFLAHRLRRRRADDVPFAAAHLVPPAPPRARRRAKLEDHALFGTRALAVVALAVLGASPLVRCSRLSLQRSGGASVAMALVIDDSMSMRAKLGDGTRFLRAREGARELLASAREGDAVAIVLAGAPARVALAATTDLGAAKAALDAIPESDRATDLSGALTMARALVSQLPQVDKRVVLLSDLADGQSDGPMLGEGSSLPVWAPLVDLRSPAKDCGVLSADRSGLRVRVRVACSHDATPAGRSITLRLGGKPLGETRAPSAAPADVVLTLAAEPPPPAPGVPPEDLVAALSPGDDLAVDDAAPVLTESGPGAIAVVADTAEEATATGGAPVVEQALTALKLDVAVRPLPVLPDRLEDFTAFVGVILDDPPGLTPEQRHALGAFLDDGGIALMPLGPRAASAPLGATLEPIVPHAVTWTDAKSAGVDLASARGSFGEVATTLADLGASRRAVLAPSDLGPFESLLAWSDGAPFVARRSVGRGEAWIVTLPFSVATSDLPLRPGFLSLLDAWVDKARLRASPRRGEVGAPWLFAQGRALSVEGPSGPLDVVHDPGAERVVPPLLGSYHLRFDAGKGETRVAAPAEREIDFRPRKVQEGKVTEGLGATHASVDVSWAVALALLGLLTVELALRVRARVLATD